MKKETYASVWDALCDTPEEAANMTARSTLMLNLEKRIKSWKVTQREAAKRLGVTAPRLNDLLRGKIEKFSLDHLVNMAVRSGYRVEFKVSLPSAAKTMAARSKRAGKLQAREKAAA